MAEPAVSSDDRYIAYSSVLNGSNGEAVRFDTRTGTSNVVSTSPGADDRPVLSPGNDWVLFKTLPAGRRNLVIRRADSTGDVLRLPEGPQVKWADDWIARNGSEEYLLFDANPGGDDEGLWYRRRSGSAADWEEPQRFLRGPFVAAQFSPNGRYVAHTVWAQNTP